MNAFLTTAQAAARLGVSDSRVRQLILEGRLPAKKVGRDYLIEASDLKLVKDRKTGRPPSARPAVKGKVGRPGKDATATKLKKATAAKAATESKARWGGA